MKTLFTAATLLMLSSSFAQELQVKFGDVSISDINLPVYERDSSAAAVILFDKGECSLDDDLNGTFKRHVRIKFFNNKAIADWATKVVYLSREDQGIYKINAVTYNLENGAIAQSKMTDDAVFKTRFDKYTDEVKFTLPNVKPGSIIEYSYTIRTRASLLPSWHFQHDIPVIWSEYVTRIPSNFAFRKDMQGFLGVSKHDVDRERNYERWVVEHAPAFKEEAFTTNIDDYLSSIHFYLSEVFIPGRPVMKFGQTWSGISKNLLEDMDFGGMIKSSGFLKKNVDEVIAAR